MNQNFQQEVQQEIEFFKNKFIGIGWEDYNENGVVKNVSFAVNEYSKNDEWRNKLAITFTPTFLSYKENDIDQLKVWIQCTVSCDYNPDPKLFGWRRKCPQLQKIMDTLLEDIAAIGWGCFFDGGIYGYFSSPEYIQTFTMASISFHMNKDYQFGFNNEKSLQEGVEA